MTQTDYRESSAQTDPYAPEPLPVRSTADLEIAQLRETIGENVIRAELETIREERARKAAIASCANPQLRQRLIEKQEQHKWRSRDEALRGRNELQLATFEKRLALKEAQTDATLERRTLERLRRDDSATPRREHCGRRIDPVTARWLRRGSAIDTPHIDACADLTSSLYCPYARDGYPTTSTVSFKEIPKETTLQETAFLEKRRAQYWNPKPDKPQPSPSRAAIKAEQDLDRVYEAIQEAKTSHSRNAACWICPRESPPPVRLAAEIRPSPVADRPISPPDTSHPDAAAELRRLIRGRLIQQQISALAA